uniref:Bacteriorhodopsin-like protein n=1 Tax=viral metagenome TaxID=1070528 RepID=A0A6C0B6Z1_9ZZZZ
MSNTNDILPPISNKEKDEKAKNPIQYYVKFSFTITYILLLTTGTITFIEALRTKQVHVRHVLNLETCISVVAGYFYSSFVNKIEEYSKADKKIDWADITKTRYIDWAITTPMMLLVLSTVLAFNIGKTIPLSVLITVILLNYAMLYIGYLGEVGSLDKISAMVGGFVPFIAMFGIIAYKFLLPKYNGANYLFFGAFVLIWAFYGLVYLFDEEYKNIGMNILDLIAKCFVGLSLWLYYSHLIEL